MSVVILNYNGRNFLNRLFKTLAEQTYKSFEVIFVDNASTDDSLKVVTEILQEKPFDSLDVKIVMNKKNLGFCEGNNKGLRHANGEFVVFLNNDTYVKSTWLEQLVVVMEAHPEFGACQSRLFFASSGEIQNDGHLFDLYGWGKEIVFLVTPERNVEFSTDVFFLTGASLIVRKSALVKTGNFDAQLFGGDCDLCWRLRLMGYELATAFNSTCYHYGSSATKNLMTDLAMRYNTNREKLRVLMKNYSLSNLLKRIPLSVILILAESLFLAVKFGAPLYITKSLSAIGWNISNLKNTLTIRYKIQYSRTISDREIERKMLHYPLLLRMFILTLTHQKPMR